MLGLGVGRGLPCSRLAGLALDSVFSWSAPSISLSIGAGIITCIIPSGFDNYDMKVYDVPASPILLNFIFGLGLPPGMEHLPGSKHGLRELDGPGRGSEIAPLNPYPAIGLVLAGREKPIGRLYTSVL